MLSLCLSRACLGRMMHFSIKSGKKRPFSHLRLPQPPQPTSAAAAPPHALARPPRTRQSVHTRPWLPGRSRAEYMHVSCRNAATLFLSGFPMFVPSLSWYNDALYIEMASQKSGVSSPQQVPLPRGLHQMNDPMHQHTPVSSLKSMILRLA